MSAGTTWVQEIVEMVRSDADVEFCKRAPVYERVPFFDLSPDRSIGMESGE